MAHGSTTPISMHSLSIVGYSRICRSSLDMCQCYALISPPKEGKEKGIDITQIDHHVPPRWVAGRAYDFQHATSGR